MKEIIKAVVSIIIAGIVYVLFNIFGHSFMIAFIGGAIDFIVLDIISALSKRC